MTSVPTDVDVGVRDPRAVVVELHERYARQIQRFCAHRLRSREEAEDATQLTFINALRGLQQGVSLEFESAWLFKIAENVCQNSRRSSFRRRRVETPSDLDEYQDVLGSPDHDSDELLGLSEALEDLPELQRRAIILREWRGLSYKELAAELELSQAAVETLLFRARRSLATKLTGETKYRTKRLRTDLGAALMSLKELIIGGAVKLAATATTLVVASVVASGAEVSSADASREPAPVAPATFLGAMGMPWGATVTTVGATRAARSPSQRIARERLTAPAARTTKTALESPNPRAAAATGSSLFPTAIVDGSGSAVMAPSAQPAVTEAGGLAVPSGSTSGPSVPTTPTPAPSPAPDQNGSGGSAQPPDSTPSGDTGGSTSGASDPGTTSTAGSGSTNTTTTSGDGDSTTSTSGGHKSNHPTPGSSGGGHTNTPGSGGGGHTNTPGPPDGVGAKGDHPQPPSPPGQSQGDHPQPPGPPAQAQGGDQSPGPPAQAQGGDQSPGPPAQAQGGDPSPGPPPQAQAGDQSQPPGPPAQAQGDPPQPPAGPHPQQGPGDHPQPAADPSQSAAG